MHARAAQIGGARVLIEEVDGWDQAGLKSMAAAAAGEGTMSSRILSLVVATILAAGAARIVLDTAGGPHPGGTGTRADASLAAAIAREVPVILAGGLNPGTVAGALLAVPAVGVDVASGVEAPRASRERPRKDPLAVALLAAAALSAAVTAQAPPPTPQRAR